MKKTTKEKRLVCTVDRKTWVRGNKGGISALLNEEGNMCCLGFLGETCGVPRKLLLRTAVPDSLSPVQQKKFPKVSAWEAFVEVNDHIHTSDAEKEALLKTLAKANGFSFRFVG
jgi:hypothetical protein